MLDHMILTVSNVERSLAFYEAALKPLNIKFFQPYKGEGDHPDLWGFGDGKRAFFWIKQGKPVHSLGVHGRTQCWLYRSAMNGPEWLIVVPAPDRLFHFARFLCAPPPRPSH